MTIIKIDKNTLSQADTKEDVLKAISVYDDLETMTVSEWISMTLEINHEALGLLIDNKLVAVAAVDEASDYRMDRWKEIRSFYVHPEYTELKYGSLLVNHIVDRVDARGYENTYVWVMEEDQDARDFFELQNIIPNGNRRRRIVSGVREEFLRYVYVNL